MVHEGSLGRISGDIRKHALEKIIATERGKRKYPGRWHHVYAAHKVR